MTALLLAAIVSQAAAPSPLPSSAPSLSAEWTKAPLTEKYQYARYVRKEADGTQSAILASRQVCDCDPVNAAGMIQTAFRQLPGTVVTADSEKVCGQQAQRIVLTGHADPASPDANNLEIIEFRLEPALYSLTYTFKGPAPLPNAEAALLTLCPKAS